MIIEIWKDKDCVKQLVSPPNAAGGDCEDSVPECAGEGGGQRKQLHNHKLKTGVRQPKHPPQALRHDPCARASGQRLSGLSCPEEFDQSVPPDPIAFATGMEAIIE